MREQRRTHFAYQTEEGKPSTRSVRPLALYFWGERWTLAAWCELRKDFRNFRLDRLSELLMRDETFQHETGKTLEDFLRCMRAGG